MKATTFIVVVLAVLLCVGVRGEPANREDTGVVLVTLRDHDLVDLMVQLGEKDAKGGYRLLMGEEDCGRIAVEVLKGEKKLKCLEQKSLAALSEPHLSVDLMYEKIEARYGGGLWLREDAEKPFCYQSLMVQRSVRPRDSMVIEVKYLDGWPVRLLEITVIRWPEGEAQ